MKKHLFTNSYLRGSNLKFERKIQNCSQEVISSLMGIDRSAVSRIESSSMIEYSIICSYMNSLGYEYRNIYNDEILAKLNSIVEQFYLYDYRKINDIFHSIKEEEVVCGVENIINFYLVKYIVSLLNNKPNIYLENIFLKNIKILDKNVYLYFIYFYCSKLLVEKNINKLKENIDNLVYICDDLPIINLLKGFLEFNLLNYDTALFHFQKFYIFSESNKYYVRTLQARTYEAICLNKLNNKQEAIDVLKYCWDFSFKNGLTDKIKGISSNLCKILFELNQYKDIIDIYRQKTKFDIAINSDEYYYMAYSMIKEEDVFSSIILAKWKPLNGIDRYLKRLVLNELNSKSNKRDLNRLIKLLENEKLFESIELLNQKYCIDLCD